MHECVFCNQRRISGAAEPAALENVRKIINDALLGMENGKWKMENSAGVLLPVEVAFYGGSFTALPASVQDSFLNEVRPLLSFSPESAIRVSARPDCIDFETVERLKSFGVRTIELGAQSMCDDVLILSKRGHTAADVVSASEIISSCGVSLILQMMTGLPGDSHESSILTARHLAALKPDGVRVYPAVVVRDTMLFDLWSAGKYAAHTVEEAVSWCAEICLIFEQGRIPVIRLGLNPSDELSGGMAVAGAYHPSFGELVLSKICFNLAVKLLCRAKTGSDVVITVSKGFMSKMIGQRRENLAALKKMFSLGSVKVIEIDKVSTSRIVPEIEAYWD